MKGTNKILMLLTGLLAVTSFTSCINAGVKEEKDLSTMVGRISYAARKYNKRITRNKILSGSKLTENSPYTIENFIKEAYVAFKDVMPQATKARTYQGYKEADTIKSRYYVDASKEEKFFISRGLIPAKQSYSYPLTEEEEKDYLQRIHTYIGKSKVDDFATYMNYDLLYGKNAKDLPNESNGDPDMEISIDFIDDKLINKKVEQIFNDAIKSDTKYGRSLKAMKDCMVERVTGNSPYINDIYEEITAIDSTEEYFAYQKALFDKAGWNDLLELNFNSLNDELSCHSYVPFSVQDVLNYAIKCAYFKEEPNFKNIDDLVSPKINRIIDSFDLPSWRHNNFVNDILTLTKNLISCANAATGAYEDMAPYSFVGEGLSLKENDPFVASGLDFAFPTLFKDFGGDQLADYLNEHLNGSNLRYLYLLGKASQDPTSLPGLNYLTLFNLSSHYYFYLNHGNYFEANYLNYNEFDYYIMAYYQTTDEYKESAEILNDLFEDDLKPGLREMFLNCDWLSYKDREALINKLDKMQSILVCEENGTTADLSFLNELDSYTGPIGLSMENDRAIAKAYFDCLFGSGLSRDLLFYISDPFTANAAYYPAYNKFYLYPGFAFAKDVITKLSYEEILAEYGMCIAHEMSHGFDSMGIEYPADGGDFFSREPIISEEGYQRFQEKMQLVINHYDSCYLCPGVTQSGKTVVTEATADQVAFRLLLNLAEEHPDFDYDLFFKTFAKNFVTTGNRDFLSEYKADVHPIGQARVNKLLSNCQEFIDLYGVEEGDYLYNDPDYMFQIW